jgi:predicted ester cyclase
MSAKLTRHAATEYFTVEAQQMHELAMALDGLVLSPQKEVVRAFYKDMWDHADKRLIPKIFHQDFTFRGSLGLELVGHEQFAGYVDRVTNVFGQYTTDILAMIEEGNRVSGKMRFHGYHQQKIFGVEPSGRHVWWIGMPIFTFDGPKVRDLYVLGDIYGLIVRLKDEAESGL